MILSKPFVLLLVLLGLISHGVPAAETIHVVVRGDTIFSLSRSHGVSQEDLMRRNGMTDPSQLRIGMRLSIPSSSAPSNPATSVSASEHTVAPGETLFSIARSRGVTLQELREANNFSSSHVLRAGERIRIPPSAFAPVHVPVPMQDPARVMTDPSIRWPVQSNGIARMIGSTRGVLILGRESESVRSISRGTVIHAGSWRGYGNVVIVESAGGFRFLYGANESLSVRVGDVVESGTEVGKLGMHPVTGRPELVFIVWQNGIPVDPVTAPRS